MKRILSVITLVAVLLTTFIMPTYTVSADGSLPLGDISTEPMEPVERPKQPLKEAYTREELDAILSGNHEYGHTVQLDDLGVWNYSLFVAVPSVTCFVLNKYNLLLWDYYDSPWEYEADVQGGVVRNSHATWAATTNQLYKTYTYVYSIFVN